MDSKMCRKCCRSASSLPLLLGLTDRGRNTASFPSLSVRGGGGGCRLVGDVSAGDRTSVVLVAACRRRSCQSKLHTLPPLLLLLAAAVVVTETASVGQRHTYSRQEGGNFAPQPPPLSLGSHLAPSTADSRARSPFAVPSVPATGWREQLEDDGGANTVNLWPSYESPAEHPVGSGKRNRRQLVEHCATKMSGAGYFMTPHYPQLVTDGAYTCFWQLSVVYAGQTVSLDLSDLQTSRGGGSSGDQHDDCGDSYIAVADLKGHVVRYCRPQPQPVLVGENVYVWASGHAQDSFGLRASFRSTFSTPDWNPTPPVCGGRLQAGDAFATPRYPSAYPTTRTCFWAAAATAGRRLTLTFDSFDVGRDATCESDYVTVWTSERGLIPRLCGNVIPANVSTRAYIFVFFSSDGAEDGGAIGLRARFVTDGETTEVATTKATTVGVGLLTVIGATYAQPWSSAGGGDSSSSSTSIGTHAGGSTEPPSWATTPLAGGQPTSTAIASVSANVDSTQQPSASSISYESRMTTATLDRAHSTTAAVAATTWRRPASSSVSGTGSRSTTRSSQTLGDSVAATTSPATVQPEPEFLSSSPQPDTTLQPGSSNSTRQSDVSSSMTPFPTGSATPEQQSMSTAQQQQPRTIQPTSEASAASSRTSTTLPPMTTTRWRCKLRQKPAADVASQSTTLAAPPR